MRTDDGPDEWKRTNPRWIAVTIKQIDCLARRINQSHLAPIRSDTIKRTIDLLNSLEVDEIKTPRVHHDFSGNLWLNWDNGERSIHVLVPPHGSVATVKYLNRVETWRSSSPTNPGFTEWIRSQIGWCFPSYAAATASDVLSVFSEREMKR